MAKTYPIKLSTVLLDFARDSFDETAPCLEWTYSLSDTGYGRVTVSQKKIGAHRFVWQNLVGPIGGLRVLHKCDNRKCVRIGHLFLGTQQDNIDDMRKKGRSRFTYHGKGADNPASKLTEQQAMELIELSRNGWFTRHLMKRFSLSKSQVQHIKRGKSWKHLHGVDNGYVKGQFFS